MRKDLQDYISPEKQFRMIENQVETLAREVMKNNPDLSPEILAEKIMGVWHGHPEKIRFITFLDIKPCLVFKIGFRGEEKEIHIEL